MTFIPIGLFNPIIAVNLTMKVSGGTYGCYYSWNFDQLLDGPMKPYAKELAFFVSPTST
jgi:hypothetical protein